VEEFGAIQPYGVLIEKKRGKQQGAQNGGFWWRQRLQQAKMA
jgi:hypothetical protein